MRRRERHRLPACDLAEGLARLLDRGLNVALEGIGANAEQGLQRQLVVERAAQTNAVDLRHRFVFLDIEGERKLRDQHVASFRVERLLAG